MMQAHRPAMLCQSGEGISSSHDKSYDTRSSSQDGKWDANVAGLGCPMTLADGMCAVR